MAHDPPTRHDAVWPPGIRPFRPGDEVPILAAMLGALDRGEYPDLDRHYVEESAARLPAEPSGVAVAEDAGRVAGWIIPLNHDLTVDLPYRRRGHATRLLAAGRTLAQIADLPDLRLWVPAFPGPEAFARVSGMRTTASLFQLRLPAASPVEAPRFQPDVRVRPIQPGPDDVSFTALVLDTFSDHPTPLRLDVDLVRHAHARPGFDPGTVLLVTPTAEPERLIGFCRVARYDEDGRPVGEVKHLGVVREHRGRGLGRELVRWGVTELRRRGALDVVLAVEAENDAALRLYETVGFARDVEWRRWTLPLDEDPAGAEAARRSHPRPRQI